MILQKNIIFICYRNVQKKMKLAEKIYNETAKNFIFFILNLIIFTAETAKHSTIKKK